MDENCVTIAVMPFRDLAPDPDTEFFVNGFVEDLITDLTRFPSLRVLASQSTFGLLQADRSIYDVAGDWDVQYVLEGSVRRGKKAIRVGVQLVHANEKQTMWADRFDAPLDRIFELQDEIAATVVGKLAVQIDDTRLEVAKGMPPETIPAYDRYLQGMECLKRGTLEADEESREFFQQALEIDSHCARAYSGLSLSHFNEWTCQAWHLWDESGDNAFDYAVKAAELDGKDAMAQSVLARVSRFRHDHDQANRHAARALVLNPNDAYVLIQIAISKLFGGEHKEGFDLAQKAMKLNPLHSDWYLGIAGWNLFMSKRYEEALSYLAQAGEAVVNFAAYRAACAAIQGDLDRAKHEYDVFQKEFRDKISFGRDPEPGEALRWAVQVEPFRRIEDSQHMPHALRDAGIIEIDVAAAIKSRSRHMVRPAEISRPIGNSFVREGDFWSISYDGTGARLIELKGFQDIARLLDQPGEPMHCLELTGAPFVSNSSQEVLDPQARREYRRQIEELQGELEQAESDNDAARADRVRLELDAVIDELAKATGLSGRSRKMGDSAERARTAVTWRIRSAIKKIAAAHPRLGQHLSNSIRTGSFCAYLPEIATKWEL
jgi:TolB-like protein/tetratricopeptide (TPR) repeat protein